MDQPRSSSPYHVQGQVTDDASEEKGLREEGLEDGQLELAMGSIVHDEVRQDNIMQLVHIPGGGEGSICTLERSRDMDHSREMQIETETTETEERSEQSQSMENITVENGLRLGAQICLWCGHNFSNIKCGCSEKRKRKLKTQRDRALKRFKAKLRHIKKKPRVMQHCAASYRACPPSLLKTLPG